MKLKIQELTDQNQIFKNTIDKQKVYIAEISKDKDWMVSELKQTYDDFHSVKKKKKEKERVLTEKILDLENRLTEQTNISLSAIEKKLYYEQNNQVLIGERDKLKTRILKLQ